MGELGQHFNVCSEFKFASQAVLNTALSFRFFGLK